ncbi:helix-turn-helix domain-containing protein [bacterium]|nr:helix-turn-helix domain-containing protein [bacterium]
MIRTRIDEREVFDGEAVCEALGLTKRTLSREVSLGRLRAYRRSRGTYYLGRDLLTWLEQGEYRPNQLDEDPDIEL